MGDTPINQAPSGVPEGITLAPIQAPTAAPAAAAPEGVPEGITLSAIPPATAAAPPKQSLPDIAKAALTNPATIVGPTTMLGAPTTSEGSLEAPVNAISEVLHGQIAKGLHDIWSPSGPHVIQGSPLEKIIQTFRPDFHGAMTPDDAAAQRAAVEAPIQNAPIDVAQYIDKQQHPVLKAATELGQSVLSPANVAVMISTGGLGMVDNPAALAVANRLISAGFGAQAAAQMYKHSERFKEAYDRGDASEALYQLTHAVGSGVVSYLAGNHAATGGQLPIASEFDKNVAGNVSGTASNILTKLNSLVPNSSGSPSNDLATAEDLLYKAAPPTKGQAANGYQERLHAAMPQLQEIANNNPKIDSPVEMADAIDQHIKTQEASIRNRARQLGDDPTAQVNGLESAVNQAMNKVLKDKVGGYDEAQADAAKDAILNSLRKGTGTEPRELSLEEAENLRQTWNEQVAKANGPMSQTAPGIQDSLKDAAVKAMRDQLDSHYAKVGVEGIQEWRQQEAPLIDVKDTLYDAAKRSIDAGKWSIMKALTQQKGWGILPVVAGFVGGGPAGALAGEAFNVGMDWLKNRGSNPNDLTQRAHETLRDVNTPSGANLPRVSAGPPTPTPAQAVAASVTPQGPVAPAAPAAAAPQAAVTPAASATPQVAVVGRVATPAEAAAMQAGEGVEITHSGDANGPNEVKLKVDGDDKGYLVFNHNGSTASIVSTQIFDKADQGLGYGQQMLNEAALKAKMQGSKALTSDENGDMTESAKRPWEALIRKGQPVERITLPNGKPGYSWDLTKIDAEGKPIPEEEEKTEAPKAKPAKAEANKGGDERAAAQPVVPPGPPPASNPHTAAPVATPTPPATGPLNYAAAAARGIANPTPVGQEQKPSQPDQNNLADSVLNQYPGLSKNYAPGNVVVVQASADRAAKAGDDILEFWPPNEQGTKDFPRPTGYDGKTVLEFYKKNPNPEETRNLIFGDLLHGLDSDPHWSRLKQEFTENYTPEQQAYRPKLKERGLSDKAIDDMFIRGGLVPGQGDEWKQPGRFSDKQKEILQQMQGYLKSGGTSSPTSKEELQQVVRQAATAHGVPPELLDAQADQESKYNVHAVSPKGARGLMQFMPATAKAVGLQNPENPEEAADRGAELMAQLHKRFGRWDQALAGYNTSPDNVQNAIDSYGDEWLYHLPQETQNYVHTIMGHYARGAHVPTMPGNTAHPKRANAAMQLVTPNAS